MAQTNNYHDPTAAMEHEHCPECGQVIKKGFPRGFKNPKFIFCETCKKRFKIREIPPIKEEEDTIGAMERVCLEGEPHYQIRDGHVVGLSLEVGRIIALPEEIGGRIPPPEGQEGLEKFHSKKDSSQ